MQDTDGDGICDANDNCPLVAGVVGSPCDDGLPGTVNDSLNVACTCVGEITTWVMSNTAGGAWFSIQPNPSDGNFEIIPSGSNTDPTVIKVYDALGQIIQAPLILSGVQPITLHMASEADGAYFLRASRGGESRVFRVLIQR